MAKCWEDIEGVLFYQDLPYMPEIICIELISCYHDNYLSRYFEINKIQKLVTRKYYWPTLYRDVKVYVKSYNICLITKAICYKSYKDL